MTEETIYKSLAAILIVALAIFRAWPKLRANNIFLKNPSNKYSDQIQVGPMMSPRGNMAPMNPIFFMWICILGGIAASVVFFYNSITTGNSDVNLKNIFGIFGFCLLILFAVFIHVLITESLDTSLQNLRYSLKVWFSTIAMAPILSVIALGVFGALTHTGNMDALLPLYWYMLVSGGGLGAVILAALILGVNYVSKQSWEVNEKRKTILWFSECLLGLILIILSTQIHLGFFWALMWVPYAIALGFTIMKYNFEIVEDEPEPMVESE